MRRASAVLDNEAAAVSSPELGGGEILSTLLARCSQASVYQPINNSQQQLHHSYIRDAGSFAQVANSRTPNCCGRRHVALEHLKRQIASLELVQRLTSLMSKFLQIVVALLVFVLPGIATAQNPEHRIALVIGNAGYQAGALTTPTNDAGLIAQTLQAAGFDVVGARDLDQDTLRRAFRDFLEKAQAAGPNTIAYVYLSGYGLQLEGENYFAPIDARIARDTDVPLEAI